jgi:hypothetical protein
VRRLVKTHRERIAAVVRPVATAAPLVASTPAPWAFISKR